MRHRLLATAAAATTLIAGTLALPAPAATHEPFETVRKDYVVKTKHGHIFVHVAHPARGDKIVKGPAIFTYSPYSILGLPPNFRRARDADRWVPRGYHRVWADVVGTGNSGGCFDYGGKREKETGAAVVEWITNQKWSTGKVGMIGASYEGTTATAAAVENPKGLTTIVPEAAISRWYEYAYSGGVRYFWNNEAIGHQGPDSIADEGFDTPLAFDFGLALPPPIDGGENWADRVESTIKPCDEIEHTQHAYDETPDYGKFWRERDYIIDADNIKIPVLLAHNWGDWNVKQEEAWNLFHALDNSPKKVLFMGTRWKGHDLPGGDYEKVVDRWMDHYLMGKNNGIEKLPEVVSRVATQDSDGKWHKGKLPRTTDVTLYAQGIPPTSPTDYPWQILPTKPLATGFGEALSAEFPGVDTQEAHANGHPRQNHEWLWFESPPLKKDLHIFGEIKVRIFSTVEREWITYTPVVVDVDPEKMIMAGGRHVGWTDAVAHIGTTRGFLDSRYRKSLAKQTPIKPGRAFSMTVVEKPVDYVFKKGHLIGLNLATGLNEWNVQKTPSCNGSDCSTVTINWEEGKTNLVLPVVGAPKNPRDLFDTAGHHQ